jgi:hypothetical protein
MSAAERPVNPKEGKLAATSLRFAGANSATVIIALLPSSICCRSIARSKVPASCCDGLGESDERIA